MISMKNFLLAVAFIAVRRRCAHLCASAPTSGSVPVGKVAVIFSEAFQDPKLGIAKFNVLQNQLSHRVQETTGRFDCRGPASPVASGRNHQAAESAAPVDPKTVQAKVDQLDQLKKDSQRKLEDTQAAYQKRRTDLMTPLQEEVGKALDAFAKAHGITLIIDGSQVPGVLYAAESMDVTKVFISEYNAKNPVTASTATPR